MQKQQTKNIKIIYKNKPTNEFKKIIKDYWSIEKPFYYKYTTDEIALKYLMSKREISSIVGNYSYIKLTCVSCNQLIGKFRNRSELNISRFMEHGDFLCRECALQTPIIKEKIVIKEVPKYIKIVKEINDHLELGILNEKWRELDPFSLEILIKITENDDKTEMFKSIFPSVNVDNYFRNKIWNIINDLHKKNLIYIERDDKKIIKIHNHGKLTKILEEKFPDIYLRRKKSLKSFLPLWVKLKKIDKTNELVDNKPIYSNVLKMKNERIFKPNDYYQFSIWKNDETNEIKLKIENISKDKLDIFKIKNDNE